jgi:hypothetical protein
MAFNGRAWTADLRRSEKLEALIIEGKATTQPIGSGGGSRHYEHVADFIGRSLSTRVGTPSDTLQVRIAFEIHNFGFEVQFDCGVLFDALDQVRDHRSRRIAGYRR